MKKSVILDPKDESIREKTTLLFEQIRQGLKREQKVYVEIDIMQPCPNCGSTMTVDSGDMFRKQYGKTYRTCSGCLTTFEEAIL